MLSSDQAGPARPAFPYVGGKRSLSRTIIAAIAEIPHALYAEPFLGAGGIFLRRAQPAPVEVINDLNREVANFFRILQRHYQAFLDMLRWQLSTRSDFDRLQRTDPETLTDLERAARFLYLQRLSFGGKVAGRNFGISRTAPARFDVTRLVPVLEAIHDRLARVVIECLPFAEFIARYDRAGALFYLDPPYFGSEGYYGAELFSHDDFAELATALRRLKGHFLLSINDVPEARRLFAGFRMRELATTYTAGNPGTSVAARELLISGPQPLISSAAGVHTQRRL